jgi:hypothetical protein
MVSHCVDLEKAAKSLFDFGESLKPERAVDQGFREGELVRGDVPAEEDYGPPVGVGGSVSIEVVRH